MSTILLVEDDIWLQDLYSQALSRIESASIVTASSAGESLKILDSKPVDLIILDIFLERHSGVELIHELASYKDTRIIPVIVLSAVSENDFNMSHERWAQYGVVKSLYKPNIKPRDLKEAVEHQLLKITAQETE